MATFRERLQEGMNLRNMKQVDLAKRTGMSASRISHYMNGRWEAKQDALYKIAKALHVNEAWLMGHDVPMERSFSQRESDISKEITTIEQIQFCFGEDAVTLLQKFLELNQEGQEKALSMLDDLNQISKYRKDDE